MDFLVIIPAWRHEHVNPDPKDRKRNVSAMACPGLVLKAYWGFEATMLNAEDST